MTEVGDLVQRNADGHTGWVLDGRTIQRSSDAICDLTMHMETRSVSFLLEPQNQGLRFVSGLASKPLRWFINGLASKSLGRFISGLTSKPIGQEGDSVGPVLRSSDLLRVEASRARVFQSGLKTGEGMTVGDARDIIMKVVSK
jgi:hypothetical protein